MSTYIKSGVIKTNLQYFIIFCSMNTQGANYVWNIFFTSPGKILKTTCLKFDVNGIVTLKISFK